jgi:hypothetical protein
MTVAGGKAWDTAEMDLPDWVTSHVPDLLFPIEASVVDTLFVAFKYHCVSTASGLTPDGDWVSRLDAYLAAASTSDEDTNKIRAGRDRNPNYYQGGAVLELNSGAGAMTLDDCVFVRSGNWDPNTYVHEMVHVGQYGHFGVSGFLSDYFGSSAVTVVEKWVKGEPIDLMTSSYLETDAYAIGNRFAPDHAR